MAVRTVTPTTTLNIHGITLGGSDPAIAYEGGSSYQGTIPANSTNFEITFPHTVANAAVQAIRANQNCTVKTNDITTPGQTITLLKNKGRYWTSGDPSAAKVFTVTVTKLYVTTGDEATDFAVACGDDVTP